MAEFCTHCAELMFGDQIKADIDVQAEFEKLEEGFSQSGFLCESCNLVLIGNIGGKLKVQYLPEGNEHCDWEDYTAEKCKHRFDKGLQGG